MQVRFVRNVENQPLWRECWPSPNVFLVICVPKIGFEPLFQMPHIISKVAWRRFVDCLQTRQEAQKILFE